MTMRTFIAIDIYPGEKLIRTIQAVRSRLSMESIRWTSLSPAHITLSFLGDTTELQVSLITRLLKERLNGSGAFEIGINGAGFFGSTGEPRVLWIGVEMNEHLNGLHLAVKSAVTDAGMVADVKPFRPHITIGRVRRYSGQAGIKNILSPFNEGILQKALVNEVVFYESVLKPEGAVYRPIEVIGLL